MFLPLTPMFAMLVVLFGGQPAGRLDRLRNRTGGLRARASRRGTCLRRTRRCLSRGKDRFRRRRSNGRRGSSDRRSNGRRRTRAGNTCGHRTRGYPAQWRRTRNGRRLGNRRRSAHGRRAGDDLRARRGRRRNPGDRWRTARRGRPGNRRARDWRSARRRLRRHHDDVVATGAARLAADHRAVDLRHRPATRAAKNHRGHATLSQVYQYCEQHVGQAFEPHVRQARKPDLLCVVLEPLMVVAPSAGATGIVPIDDAVDPVGYALTYPMSRPRISVIDARHRPVVS